MEFIELDISLFWVFIGFIFISAMTLYTLSNIIEYIKKRKNG